MCVKEYGGIIFPGLWGLLLQPSYLLPPHQGKRINFVRKLNTLLVDRFLTKRHFFLQNMSEDLCIFVAFVIELKCTSDIKHQIKMLLGTN